METFLKRVVFGSSALIVTLPLWYLGNAYNKLSPSDKEESKLMSVLITLPLLYGLVFATVLGLSENFELTKMWRIAIVGGVCGLIYSVAGRFIGRVPERVFKLQKDEEWTVHPYAILTYSIWYSLTVTFYENYIGKL